MSAKAKDTNKQKRTALSVEMQNTLIAGVEKNFPNLVLTAEDIKSIAKLAYRVIMLVNQEGNHALRSIIIHATSKDQYSQIIKALKEVEQEAEQIAKNAEEENNERSNN